MCICVYFRNHRFNSSKLFAVSLSLFFNSLYAWNLYPCKEKWVAWAYICDAKRLQNVSTISFHFVRFFFARVIFIVFLGFIDPSLLSAVPPTPIFIRRKTVTFKRNESFPWRNNNSLAFWQSVFFLFDPSFNKNEQFLGHSP